jgi:hypothetical protein
MTPHLRSAPKPAALARRKFLKHFRRGFYDQKYLAWERNYKWDAHLAWRRNRKRGMSYRA